MDNFDKYIGQVLDRRYLLKKIVGMGGMAVVFEAYDQLMNRTVAVKLLRDEINNDEQSVKRFINESRAVSMLNHSNIVNIYDVSVRDDLKYIVMEYIHGIPLKSYMSHKGVIAWKEALAYTEQILRALSHAHSKGIIHRDIKPQNILLLKNGVIKVADFGIAKLPNTETVTMTDKAIGTVYYISPEQASGKPIDCRSDLYSLGAMLYEMITGQLPFYADSPVSVALMQVKDEPIPPTELNPSLPRGLEQIIQRAMEKNPEERYQSAEDMLQAVQTLRAHPDKIFPPYKQTKETPSGSKGTKDGQQGEGNTGRNGRKTGRWRGGHAMLPVIAGIAVAFIIAGGAAMFYLMTRLIEAEQESDYATIKIDSFVGMSYTDSISDRMENGIYYEIETDAVYDANVPAGTVISQDPSAGETRKVSLQNGQMCKVLLTISKGAETFVLPDLTIREYREVKLLLERMGMKCEIIEDYNDTILEGYVVSTEPAASETVTSGDTIKLYVSKGQMITYVEVPDCLGKSREEAINLLISADLALGKVNYVKSDREMGIVLAQSKPQGTSVPRSSTKIDLTVSGGPTYGEETDTDTGEETDTEQLPETEANGS